SLLDEATTRAAYILALRTLILTDSGAEARAAIDALGERGKTRGSLRLRSAAAAFSGELCLRAGRPAKAEHCARLALDLAEDELNLFSGAALAVLVGALAERGAFDEAHRALHARDLAGELPEIYWAVRIRHARARLALAQGDYEAAYADAIATGAQREAQGRPNPSWTAWRSTAALALAGLGRYDEAAVLADEELELAERFGAPVPVVVALHARAVAERDDHAREAICSRALEVAAGADAVLATVRVQLELGRTLLRLGRPMDARELLRPALADADAVGAS